MKALQYSVGLSQVILKLPSTKAGNGMPHTSPDKWEIHHVNEFSETFSKNIICKHKNLKNKCKSSSTFFFFLKFFYAIFSVVPRASRLPHALLP